MYVHAAYRLSYLQEVRVMSNLYREPLGIMNLSICYDEARFKNIKFPYACI